MRMCVYGGLPGYPVSACVCVCVCVRVSHPGNIRFGHTPYFMRHTCPMSIILTVIWHSIHW